MIKFFRKIRQNLLMENKTGKYFKYAIGEIVLVVIGILIALQINNWNENRKEKTFENQVYKQIYNDLISDSLRYSDVINFYKKRGTLINRVLYDSLPSISYDTITKENQHNFDYGINLINNYQPLFYSKKGYQLFKAFNTKELKTDSLSIYIEDYYSLVTSSEGINKLLINILTNSDKEFHQKDWYLDIELKRRLSTSYLDYIKNSDDFKTRIMYYRSVFIKYFARDLKGQQESAEVLKRKIKNRLEK
jgi:hypothetical protein